MRVAVRVDASLQIGTGHFMRTLALANCLAKNSVRVRFVCRDLPSYLAEVAASMGHEVAIMPTDGRTAVPDGGPLAHSHWLRATQASDALQCHQALLDANFDWVVVDHYALDSRWESSIRGRGRKILVIDDLADRKHDCDVILDQNLYPNLERRYDQLVPDGCEKLLGPRFALLREEFARVREGVAQRPNKIGRILVFMGGGDAFNHTGRVLAGIASARISRPHVDVVIGKQHPNLEEILAFAKLSGFYVHIQTDQMANLMAVADLSVGATGSASWERCCLGLPTIGVPVAANQVPIGEALRDVGAIIMIGASLESLANELASTLETLSVNTARLADMASVASTLVDGGGCQRVVTSMFNRA